MSVTTNKRSTNSRSLTTAWILVGNFAGEGEPQHYVIRSFPFLIGRRSDAALCLPFPTVSGVHAEIDLEDQQIILRDLQSTNGTFVNGRRIKERMPLQEGDLLQLADVALRLQRQDSGTTVRTLHEDVCDQALALVQFDKLMSERRVTPNYQPIVTLESRAVVAYEVVGRSPLLGVETPQAMFRAAAKLNLEVPLSNMLRWEGVVQSIHFPILPHLFVNTHPRELEQVGLIDNLRELRKVTPAQRLTLEIHENAVSCKQDLIELQAALRDLDISLAYDDFGTGQSRFNELTEVCPDYLKFDISLIRNLDLASEKRQQMVHRLVSIGRDLGAITLAEGVETEGEAQICREMGLQLGQGFLFGRPARASQAFA